MRCGNIEFYLKILFFLFLYKDRKQDISLQRLHVYCETTDSIRMVLSSLFTHSWENSIVSRAVLLQLKSQSPPLFRFCRYDYLLNRLQLTLTFFRIYSSLTHDSRRYGFLLYLVSSFHQLSKSNSSAQIAPFTGPNPVNANRFTEVPRTFIHTLNSWCMGWSCMYILKTTP